MIHTIAYGHFMGSGSNDFDAVGDSSLTPSRAIYSQYRNILLPPGDDYFTLADGHVVTQSIFVNINSIIYDIYL